MTSSEFPSASASTPKGGGSGGKRKRGRPSKSGRGRKRQKRLDAICDAPVPTPAPGLLSQSPADDEPASLRRSTRARHPPAVLDSSPTPSGRRRKHRYDGSQILAGDGALRRGREIRQGGRTGDGDRREEEETAQASGVKETSLGCPAGGSKNLEEDTEDWKSRLRSRVGKGKGKPWRLFADGESLHSVSKTIRDQRVGGKTSMSTPASVSSSRILGLKRRGKVASVDEVSEPADEVRDQDAVLPLNYEEDGGEQISKNEETEFGSTSQVVCESAALSDSLVGVGEDKDLAIPSEFVELEKIKEETEHIGEGEEKGHDHTIEEGSVIPNQQIDNICCPSPAASPSNEHPNINNAGSMEILKDDQAKPCMSNDKLRTKQVKEGRRCGLCGGGTDGKPPKRFVPDFSGSDKETFEGSSASEEHNYDVWDGFGDEPGWLGRLLGPIRDRFGIARVWVHQHCAVWSPEVYFAGLGCLKNVRAALYRGRALKCSRCGRPGATIGCRVDRCPKTYHLPCSRAEGCIFDHRKFLIACHDHRRFFQPQGNDYAQAIKKLKVKKLKLEVRKISHDAWRKDVEAEEKWLENCGEDEEFLKREGKRLHRDLLRIAPVYIGGSSECQKSYQGWESVAGLQDVINCMKEVVILPLLYPELFETLGLTPPRGILLHGHPGTGKTLVVRALIGACSRGDKRIAYFARKGADCLGKYVGDAERQLRLLFQVAERSQPSIIFFDEIDGLAPCRSRHSDQTHNSVVSTLLSLLDGLKSRGSVIVIGATNRPDAIDPALRRPGRFDREIYFPLPSMKDRASIVSLHTKNWPSSVSGSLLSWIANQTSGYAGADLQALCTQAAMNALKRNCPLQEILTSAEKLSGKGKLPSLPSFTVEEKDWIAALAVAPPPCSRRASGMAANDVASAPLFSHLVPSLLKPLSKLLISLYIDERIWLSPTLIKASKSIKNVIIFALEQKNLAVGSWWFNVDSLIQQPYIAKEVIKSLSQYGLVSGQRGYDQSLTLNNDVDDLESYDYLRSKSSNSSAGSKLNKESAKFGTSSGFRVLIAGKPRSGQHHLGSCLIHGFKGHIDIQKINLATILQEGNGDIIRGLTQILLKCMSLQKCIIYMPRMDLWAIDEIYGKSAKHNEMSPNISALSPASEVDDIRKVTSEAWNLFLEQVNSVSASASIIILATCELEICDIPDGIRQFFSDGLSDINHSVRSEKSVPRFLVDIDGNFDPEIMISSFAAKLSEDLVQEYFQLVYHTTHVDIYDDKGKTFHAREVKMDGQESEEQIVLANMITNVEHYRAPCDDSQNVDSVQRFSTSANIRASDADIQCHDHQDSNSRISQSRVIKGGSALAIATFGYQILRLPQFAELCWVSSKLREGPCTDTNGPWKGWPFNSCIISTSPSLEKVVPGVNNGRVRGLVAVGLLAYRGIYTSVREVSSEVRKVLELLVGRIRAKILGGKDRYCYHRILSQVAYLEDIVCSWAYTFKSLPGETHKSLPYAKSIVSGETPVNNDLDASCVVGNHRNRRTSTETGCSKLDNDNFEGSPHKLVTRDGDSTSLCTETAGHTLSTSDVLVVTKEPCSSFPFPTSICPSSVGATSSPPSQDGVHRSENMMDRKDHFSGFEEADEIPPSVDVSNRNTSVTETNVCSEVAHGSGLHNSGPSVDVGSVTDQGAATIDLAHYKTANLPSASEFSCVYNCCFGCLHAVYLSVRNILSETLRSTGSCSKVDDVHELFASCSLNLTNAIRNCCISPSTSSQEEYAAKEKSFGVPLENCACKGFANEQFKRAAAYSNLEEVKFLPTACNCHWDNMEDVDMDNYKFNPPLQPLPSFSFRNGVLMPLDRQLHPVFHCKNEKLCVCSILRMISSNK